MNRDEIRKLYDDAYAASYESKFISGPLAQVDAAFEVELIARLLPPDDCWLDTACGTGYFLSQFPMHRRHGVDLSPAMIRRAQLANPGVEFTEWDLRDPRPEWNDQWNLVSCMWYAYGLVDSIREVIRVLDHLADWTHPEGKLLLPYSNPRQIIRAEYPYRTDDTPWEGDVTITGIIWSYVEEGGAKSHAHQISVTPEYLLDILGARFEKIEKVDYPPAMPGWEGVRSAFIASGKRSSISKSM